jgi:hypothetical protein
MTTTILAIASGQAGGIKFSTAMTNAPPFVEALEGETLSVVSDGPPIVSITTVASPAGDPPVIDDEATPCTIALAAVGRHHFRVRTGDGVDTDVSAIVCESAALDRINARTRDGHRDVDRRRVLRELARNDQTFTGLASQLAGKPLENFGA